MIFTTQPWLFVWVLNLVIWSCSHKAIMSILLNCLVSVQDNVYYGTQNCVSQVHFGVKQSFPYIWTWCIVCEGQCQKLSFTSLIRSTIYSHINSTHLECSVREITSSHRTSSFKWLAMFYVTLKISIISMKLPCFHALFLMFQIHFFKHCE